MRRFAKLKPSRNGEITLSFTDVSKSCQHSVFLNVANMSFILICASNILAKVSEFAVSEAIYQGCLKCLELVFDVQI